MNLTFSYEPTNIDWHQLAELYKRAPLGQKVPEELKTVFKNSMYKCFVYDGSNIVGVGRALADGADCSYICDVAVLPKYQGFGLGKQIVQKLMEFSKGHNKIILYANPGKEGFYTKLGFKRMNTAMAIFKNEEDAIKTGTISAE